MDRARLADGEGAHKCLRPTEDEAVHVSRVVPKRVEEFKDTAPALGRARNLMQEGRAAPTDRPFGIATTGEGEWTAADCLGGEYTPEQQGPDRDLGKSTRPGWRNVAADTRAYGVPTIRRDIPAKPVKSVADHQNYGDDSSAAELINPSRFAAFGVHDDEFLVSRDAQVSEAPRRGQLSSVKQTWPRLSLAPSLPLPLCVCVGECLCYYCAGTEGAVPRHWVRPW